MQIKITKQQNTKLASLKRNSRKSKSKSNINGTYEEQTVIPSVCHCAEVIT